MAITEPLTTVDDAGAVARVGTAFGRVAISLFVPVIAFIVLWQGFLFLRSEDVPRWLLAAVAIVWGVGGVAALYVIGNWLIEKLPLGGSRRLIPFLFVGPAIAILVWYLALPTVRTLIVSFQDADSRNFVGLQNYIFAFTDAAMLTALRNNLLWLVLGTGLSVTMGLLIAVLADRSSFERLAKILIFLPLAISFVGAGVIWRFVYSVQPRTADQIGLLNGILTTFGIDPQPWLLQQPWNNIFLIVILMWMQTGFAMVILSAALKGVPDELIEAGKIDGASERQIFFSIILPSIKTAVITVTTTILILTLKIYDIVQAMTGGNFGTDVIATLQFKQMFEFFNYGRGGALAIILLAAVVPVMWYNLRQFRRREVF